MLGLAEGEKPRPIHRRVVAGAPAVAAAPIRGSRLLLRVQSQPDSTTASWVDSYNDTPSMFVLSQTVEETVPTPLL